MCAFKGGNSTCVHSRGGTVRVCIQGGEQYVCAFKGGTVRVCTHPEYAKAAEGFTRVHVGMETIR